MKTILVKVRVILSFSEPNEVSDHIRDLRKWCYANVKYPWSTYHMRGIDNPDPDSRIGFVAFEFANDQEAMKFKLYVGK